MVKSIRKNRFIFRKRLGINYGRKKKERNLKICVKNFNLASFTRVDVAPGIRIINFPSYNQPPWFATKSIRPRSRETFQHGDVSIPFRMKKVERISPEERSPPDLSNLLHHHTRYCLNDPSIRGGGRETRDTVNRWKRLGKQWKLEKLALFFFFYFHFQQRLGIAESADDADFPAGIVHL